MKTKTYQTPTMEVITLNIPTLLTGSGDTPTGAETHDEGFDPGQSPLSRSFGDLDDEE